MSFNHHWGSRGSRPYPWQLDQKTHPEGAGTLKKDSSKFVKTLDDNLRAFHWQDGYGLFSISPSHFEAVRKYILNQEEHHKKETFQDEFRRLLKKYSVSYDERYVSD